MNKVALENWVKSAIFDIARITGTPVTYGKVTKPVTCRNKVINVTVDITEEDFVTYNRKKDENISFACSFT